MRNNALSRPWITIVVLALATLAVAPRAMAQQEKQEKAVYTFTNLMGGLDPQGGLVFDKAGNIYGVTSEGGQFGDGTVFKLTITTNGGAVESVLHSFKPDGQDGLIPNGGLILDASGNLYGTTYSGGSRLCPYYLGTQGCGTVYELILQPDGAWTEQILHEFTGGGRDGANPEAGLVFDAAGNLYGTTYYGGSSTRCSTQYGKTGCGTAFELMPGGDGAWQEKLLFNFYPNAGTNPIAGLTLDASGNLYGTTPYAGTGSNGTVFELTASASGVWNEAVLHNFAFGTKDGADPESGVSFDSSGNLYGTTFLGGDEGYGTLYKLMPSGAGTWIETILHSFQGNHSDAAQPGPGALVLDSAGNLYGATGTGGTGFEGTVFQFSPSAGGDWTENILYSFSPGYSGYYPFSGVILDSAGDIYGTTGDYGGNNKSVYEIVRTE
jgi:uncharacterized repeat protein (TIGR03803 family)